MYTCIYYNNNNNVIWCVRERTTSFSCEMFRITTHTRSAAAAVVVVQLVSVEWTLFYSPIKEREEGKKRRRKCASHPASAIFPYRDADWLADRDWTALYGSQQVSDIPIENIIIILGSWYFGRYTRNIVWWL